MIDLTLLKKYMHFRQRHVVVVRPFMNHHRIKNCMKLFFFLG